VNSPSFLKRLFTTRTGAADADIKARPDRRTKKTIALCHALLSERGEASGAALAREALASYSSIEAAALPAFFNILAEEFSTDPQSVGDAADAYRGDPSQSNLIRLQHAVESPRQELFRRLNMAAGATGALVEMRRRLLLGAKANPHWAGIEADLAHLLSSWFNRGFLKLERIDWRTSALVLEKLIQYEAVHEVQGWHDLHRRLEADRRCYAFFHPALPDEPIIFIEVALTRGMCAEVQPLLDPDSKVVDPDRADAAMFYSITNCQEGLRGVSFGNFLIKQVAEDLGREFPRVKTFATLSPIPGFRKWLTGNTAIAKAGLAPTLALLDEPDWTEAVLERLQPALMKLCAWYLLHAKTGSEPTDAVARFHLGNGARMERLNWLGDTSKQGMARSAGLMVNYVYRLDEVERNHEAYVKEHQVVASARLAALARDCPLHAGGAKPA
jgi:malonyl-CoA decarboxylase